MAKQKQDNKTIDIELLILRDKIECLIDEYNTNIKTCSRQTDKFLLECFVDNLKELLEN